MKPLFAIFLLAVIVESASGGSARSQPPENHTTPRPVIASTSEESAFRYPSIDLQGQLAEIFSVTDCEYISGLTCRIHYNGKAPLPSDVFFVAYDAGGKPDGAKVRLIYPRLEPGESGRATFRIRSSSPTKLVLQGLWDGPLRSPY
jgi:hypothetical protein